MFALDRIAAWLVAPLAWGRMGALTVLLVSSLWPIVPARGDAIMVTRAASATTIAEFFVGQSAIRVELEIGIADLEAFRNLLPNPIYERLGFEREPLADRLPRFFTEDLTIRAEDGSPLPGRVLEMEGRPRARRDQITGELLPPTDEEPEIVIAAVLEYTFEGRPSTLTFTAPRNARGGPGATIGFVVHHEGLPVTDFRYLASAETLDLDWLDPWYSSFRNRNLRRQYDAPLNVFIYVEPYEVRCEIIVRPRDLQQWIDLGLGGPAIPVDAQPEIRQRTGEFLAQHLDLTIDGNPVTPTLDRIHFLKRTLRSSRVIDPPEELLTVSATLGAIFVTPTDGLPQEAVVTWDLFSPRITRVPAAATDEAGPLPYMLTAEDPVLRWQNFLKNPTIPTLVEVSPPPAGSMQALGVLTWIGGIGLVVFVIWGVASAARGRGRPGRGLVVGAAAALLVTLVGLAATQRTRVSDQQSAEIVQATLHNVYRAFDFRDESTIYDALQRSVTGELLTQTYLETRKGLELASQGGARVKVKEIEVLEVTPRNLQGEIGFLAQCVWNVSGSVGHWGHVHTRTNRYRADLTLKPVDGAWKLTDLELLEEERL